MVICLESRQWNPGVEVRKWRMSPVYASESIRGWEMGRPSYAGWDGKALKSKDEGGNSLEKQILTSGPLGTPHLPGDVVHSVWWVRSRGPLLWRGSPAARTGCPPTTPEGLPRGFTGTMRTMRQCPEVAITNHHQVGVLKSRNLFSHCSGGQKSTFKVLASLCSLWMLLGRIHSWLLPASVVAWCSLMFPGVP